MASGRTLSDLADRHRESHDFPEPPNHFMIDKPKPKRRSVWLNKIRKVTIHDKGKVEKQKNIEFETYTIIIDWD